MDSCHREAKDADLLGPLTTTPYRVSGIENPMATDEQLIRLIARLASSSKYFEMSTFEQRRLCDVVTWSEPLDECQRHLAYSILEQYAEEIRL